MSLKCRINYINPCDLYIRSRSTLPEQEKEEAIKSAIAALASVGGAHATKSSPSNAGSIPAYVFSVQPRSSDPSEALLIEYYNGAESTFRGYRLEIRSEGEKHIVFFDHTCQAQIKQLIDSLSSAFDGDAIETMRFSQETQYPKPHYWNPSVWKGNENGDIYRHELYPMIEAYAHYLLKSGNQTVLEVCGGDGELAYALFDHFEPRIRTYHLIDLNEESLEKARSNLKKQTDKGQAILYRADVANDPIDGIAPGTVDLAIGCGALNYQVLKSREEACRVLDQLVSLIKPGGALVLTGRTMTLVNSRDLSMKGLTVKNRSNPFDTHFPFYVAVKPSKSPV
jgi:hypothetical protein